MHMTIYLLRRLHCTLAGRPPGGIQKHACGVTRRSKNKPSLTQEPPRRPNKVLSTGMWSRPRVLYVHSADCTAAGSLQLISCRLETEDTMPAGKRQKTLSPVADWTADWTAGWTHNGATASAREGECKCMVSAVSCSDPTWHMRMTGLPACDRSRSRYLHRCRSHLCCTPPHAACSRRCPRGGNGVPRRPARETLRL